MSIDEEAKSFFERSIQETESLGRVSLPLPAEYKQQLENNISAHFRNKQVFQEELPQDVPVSEKFTDQNFKPEDSSLINPWNMADIVSQIEWKQFQWRRLSDVFPLDRMRVFDNISPDDINQGKLGDCYFLSTLSAIAEKGERIQCLFPSPEIPQNCQYRVRLMDLGFWKNYSIDDYFPMQDPSSVPTSSSPEGSSPPMKDYFVFSGPKKGSQIVELWVCLLEKAWAKKYGSYYAIQSGFTDEALTDLTGAPCQTISTKSVRLWRKMLEADQKDYIITAGCVGTGLALEDEVKYKTLGLVLDHAYAVISAREVTLQGKQERLLKIRNPWGAFEWAGDWGDNSEKWTEEAKNALNFQGKANDGTFWISIEDFQKYFENCTICRFENGFKNVSLAMDQTKDEEFSVVEVQVSEPTKLYFMVCQLDERRFGGFESGYQYSPVRLIAAESLEGGGLRYIDGKVSLYSRDAWIYLDLQPGIYLVYIEMNWKSQITDLFGVSVYCSAAVSIKDVSSQCPNFLQDCYSLDFFNESSMKTAIFKTDWLNCSCVRLIGGKDSGELMEGIYVDVYENASDDQRIILTIRHDPWTNCQVLKPYGQAETGDYQLTLEPKKSIIVLKKHRNLLEKHAFKMLMKRNFIAVNGGP